MVVEIALGIVLGYVLLIVGVPLAMGAIVLAGWIAWQVIQVAAAILKLVFEGLLRLVFGPLLWLRRMIHPTKATAHSPLSHGRR